MASSVEKVSVSDVTIELSETAFQHLCASISKAKDAAGVRLSLKKSGCSGLSYQLDYIQVPEASDVVLPVLGGFTFCVEKSAYPFVKGTRIDYVRDGLNYKMIYQNPNQTGECGCGESFTVDEL